MQSDQTQPCNSKFQVLKKLLFQLIVQQISSTRLHRYIYVVFLIIENIQILYYSIHSKYTFLWKTNAMNVMQYLIRYFQATAYLDSFPQIYMELLTINLLLIFIPFIIIVRQLKRIKNIKYHKQQITSCDKYTINLLNYFIMSFKTYLHIPCIFMILSILTNSNYTQDLSIPAYYIFLVLNILALVIFLFYMTIFNIFYNNSEPFSQHPSSTFEYYQDIYKSIIKTILPLYILLDPTGNAIAFFQILILLFYIAWIILYYQRFQLYKYPQRIIYRNTPVVCAWITLFSCYQMLNRQQSEGLAYLIISIAPIIFAWKYVLDNKIKKILAYNLAELKTQKQVMEYFLQIIKLVEQKQFEGNEFKLMSAFTLHFKSCQNNPDECCCRQIMQKLIVKTEVDVVYWYQFLKDMIKNHLNKFPDSINLSLLLSYIYMKRLNNKYKSIYYRNKVQANENLSIVMQLKSYMFMKEIQFKINEENIKTKQKKSNAIKTLYMFNRRFSQFRQKIFECCNKYIEFWKQLSEQHPQGIKIYEISENINIDYHEIHKIFKELLEINPNNLKMLLEYSLFMQNIRGIKDQQILAKIHDAQLSMLKKNKVIEIQRAKYGDNAQTGIMVVSVNQTNIGQILYANSHVFNLLEFKSVQIIKKNLNMLIPLPFQTYHQKRLKNYIQGTIYNKEGIQKTVYILNKQSQIIYISMMLETLPNISEGVCLIGYFSRIPINPNYILCDNQGKIYGISKGFSVQYDIKFDECQCIKTKLGQLCLKDMPLQTLVKIELKIQKEKKIKTMSQIESKNLQVTISLKQKRIFPDLFQLNLLVFQNPNEMGEMLIQSQLNFLMNNPAENIKQPQQLNDIQKQLQPTEKEFIQIQNIIQNQQQPRKIKCLNKFGFLILFIILGLSTLSLPLFFQKIERTNDEITLIGIIHRIRSKIIDMSYNSRNINVIKYAYNTPEMQFQAKYVLNLTMFQLNSTDNYFNEYNKITQNIASQGAANLISLNYKYYSVSYSNFSFDASSVPLSACLLQLLTSISNLYTTNTSLFKFIPILDYIPYPINSLQANFINIIKNCLYSIIPALMATRSVITNFYANQIYNQNYGHIIVFVFALVFIILLVISSLYINFKYAKVGLKVLGLFSHINKYTIQKQIDQISAYLNKNLTDLVVYKQNNITASMSSKKKLSINLNYANQAGQKSDNQLYLESGRNENQQLHNNNIKKNRRETKPHTHQNGFNTVQKARQIELKNTKINRIKSIFVKYLLLGFTLFAYFLSDYIIINNQLASYVKSNLLYDYIGKRIQLIQIIQHYTFENFFQVQQFLDQPLLINKILDNVNQLYQVERYLSSAITQNNKFSQLISDMNQIDICTNLDLYSKYFNYDSLNYQNCVLYDNQALSNGIKSAIVSWLDVVNQVYLINFNNKNISNLSSFFIRPQIQTFAYMPAYLIPAISYQMDSYNDIINSEIQLVKTMFILKFAVFLVILIIVFVLWVSFIQQLKSMVQKIKGLVLIITFKKIQNNNELKNDIIENKILESFK